MNPCDTCIEFSDHSHFRFPDNLVHPEHGKRMVFDVRGLAVCGDCCATWQLGRDNEVRLVG